MKLLECCLQTAANNFISSALNNLYLQYRFCPGISRFKPWWLGQDKTWKHLQAANFLYKTSWMCPWEFLPGISTASQTPIKQSESAAMTWELNLGPSGCNSHQHQEPKRVFTIHHLPVYPPHKENPKILEGIPGKQRNYRFHRGKYHPPSTLKTSLQPELFYDSLMLYLTLIRLRGQQIPVCMEMQFTIYQAIKHFNPKEGSTGFLPQSQQVNLTQFVLQAWQQWRQEINLSGCKETQFQGTVSSPFRVTMSTQTENNESNLECKTSPKIQEKASRRQHLIASKIRNQEKDVLFAKYFML